MIELESWFLFKASSKLVFTMTTHTMSSCVFDQLVAIMPAHNCCYLPKSLLFIPEGGGKNHALSQFNQSAETLSVHLAF